jgi:hypothetical protein
MATIIRLPSSGRMFKVASMWRSLFLLCLAVRAAHPADPAHLADGPANSNTGSLNALEEKFKDTLANCVFNGRWCLVEKGKLSEEYQDKYTIQGATKSGRDVWLIYARVQYGGKDVTVPVPIQLKWAGDTPVMSLEKVSIPGLGTYSARVLVYENTYAGTWSANDHGGMLHGLIEKAPAKKPQ